MNSSASRGGSTIEPREDAIDRPRPEVDEERIADLLAKTKVKSSAADYPSYGSAEAHVQSIQWSAFRNFQAAFTPRTCLALLSEVIRLRERADAYGVLLNCLSSITTDDVREHTGQFQPPVQTVLVAVSKLLSARRRALSPLPEETE